MICLYQHQSRLGISEYIPSTIQRVTVSPTHKCFLSIQKQYLDSLLRFKPQPTRSICFHRSPFGRQSLIDTPRSMHNHRTRCCTICCSNKPRGRKLAIIMRNERQPPYISRLCPRWIACNYNIDERYLFIASSRRRRGRVLEFDCPFGEVGCGPIYEVLLDCC